MPLSRAAGHTAMEILGHSRITVTSRYQHVVEIRRDAAEKMDAFWAR